MAESSPGKRKWLWRAFRGSAALVLAFSLLFSGAGAGRAEKPAQGSDLKEQREQLNQVQNQIDQTRRQLDQVTKQEKKVLLELERVEKELDRTRDELGYVEGQYRQATAESLRLQKSLAEAERQLAEADAQLQAHLARYNRRLRAIYEWGEPGYLELVFTAEDYADLIVRAELFRRLLQSDARLYREVQAEKARVVAVRARVAGRRAEVEKNRQRMAALRAEIARKASQLEARVRERERVLAEIQSRRESYEQALRELEETSRRLEKWIQEQQLRYQRAGDLAKLKGTFLWPVRGRVTSEFGWRVHPIFKTRLFHEGLDLAVPMGTPVKAAAPGQVILSGWAGGYGKTVIIDHGGGVSTLYGHNSRLKVAVGDQVAAGEVIAEAGSTGFSTGPHVHFEVRVNGVPVDPRDWLE
ncbi:MAG: peptidoglycan DD-metalloendopeptidase family protein [Bacillota bacterium]|nr:peptidoglycan DD-metalloendopeptidase family protein [Bacillota bacterium]